MFQKFTQGGPAISNPCPFLSIYGHTHIHTHKLPYTSLAHAHRCIIITMHPHFNSNPLQLARGIINSPRPCDIKPAAMRLPSQTKITCKHRRKNNHLPYKFYFPVKVLVERRRPLPLPGRRLGIKPIYPQFCSAGEFPSAPIRLQYLKWINHTHSTLPRVNFVHVGLTKRRGQHPL